MIQKILKAGFVLIAINFVIPDLISTKFDLAGTNSDSGANSNAIFAMLNFTIICINLIISFIIIINSKGSGVGSRLQK